jgi:hypothetical protein
VAAYMIVFAVEALFLGVSLWMLGRINVSAFHRQADGLSVVERAAMAAD